jgi:hypothetical protein
MVGVNADIAKFRARNPQFANVVLPQTTLEPEVLMYVPNLDRAAKLATDLKAHPSLLEYPDASTITRCLDSILDSYNQADIKAQPVTTLFGVAGCGKTTACRQIISTMSEELRDQVRFVCHNEFMRGSAKSDFGGLLKRGFNFPTLRSMICEPSSGPVFLDDGGKFWGGYLDLMMIVNPLAGPWYVNGDPLQGREQIPIPMCQSKHLLSPVHQLARTCTKYATTSHRVFTKMADFLGIYTTSVESGLVDNISGPIAGYPYITSSERYVSVLSQGGRTAYTFGTVQGLEFSIPVVLDVTGLEQSMSDANTYIAFTRSKSALHIMSNYLRKTPLNPGLPSGSDLLNAMLWSLKLGGDTHLAKDFGLGRLAFVTHLHNCLPNFFDPHNIGSVDFNWSWPDARAVAPEAVDADSPAPTSVQPFAFVASELYLTEPHLRDHDLLEASTRVGLTSQFATDTRLVNPMFHSRYDRATEQLSLAKRIAGSSTARNVALMKTAKPTDLYDAFDRLFPKIEKCTVAELDLLAERVAVEYLSRRTEAQVRAKIAQQDPTLTPSDIKLFLKQQIVKKVEKMFSPASPGQLIHEFPLAATLADAVFVLWLEERLLDQAPPNLVFLRRLSPAQIRQRYRDTWHVGRGCSWNDYTSWDAGCDHNITALDVHIFKRCGFPSSFIDSYVARKTSSRSFVGVMAIMQNSGDRFTWPLNSLRNAVVTTCNFGFRLDVCYWFNGDDFICDNVVTPTGLLTTPLRFVGKFGSGPIGIFSGWRFSGSDCFTDSASLLYRCDIASARGRSDIEYWQSAADLAQFCCPDDVEYPHIVARLAQHGVSFQLAP